MHLFFFRFLHSSLRVIILASNDSSNCKSVLSDPTRADFFRLRGGSSELVVDGVNDLLKNLNLSRSFFFHEPYYKSYNSKATPLQ